MIDTDRDRRQSLRITLRRPCKLFNPRSGKYASGTTCNVSSGGVLIRLERPFVAEPGDRIYVGIARRHRQALLRTAEMIEARVVRVLTATSGEAAMALQFRGSLADVPLPLPAAA